MDVDRIDIIGKAAEYAVSKTDYIEESQIQFSQTAML